MTPSISYHCDDLSFEWIHFEPIVHWLLSSAAQENQKIDSLQYIYCTDEALLKINQDYLSHDYYTDVITFDLSDGEDIEGEIYISLDRVLENSKTEQVSLENELCRVMIHGLLHLLGYHDDSQTERQEMKQKEDHYLSLLSNVPRGTLQ